MDNRRFFRQAMVLTLAAGLLASCSKDDAGVPDSDDQLIPVSPGIALSTKAPDDPSTSSSTVLNQVVEGLTFSFLRADNTAGSRFMFAEQSFTGTCAEPYQDGETGEIVAAITFDPAQYYLVSGKNTYMRGWYPVKEFTKYGNTEGEVLFLIDGKTDIMLSDLQEGNQADRGIKKFTFAHLLTQIQFQVVAESAIAAEQWGNVTAIELERENTECLLILENQDCITDLSNRQTITAFLAGENIPILYGKNTFAGVVMVEERTIRSASSTINLKVTTTGKGEMDEAIDLNDYENVSGMKFEAGSAYTLTLRFLQDDVEIEVRPAEWRNPAGEVNVEVGGDYPHVKDGKYIISGDLLGSTGESFHEPWTSTTVNTDVASVSAAFEVAAEDATVDGNAEMNWYVAAGQQDGTANPDTKNACPEGWRLPTIKELELIQAQAEKLDVEKLVSPDGYWSATETEGKADHAHIWESGNSLDRQVLKTEVGKVRCVRDI